MSKFEFTSEPPFILVISLPALGLPQCNLRTTSVSKLYDVEIALRDHCDITSV
jgi:hypothetical protein